MKNDIRLKLSNNWTCAITFYTTTKRDYQEAIDLPKRSQIELLKAAIAKYFNELGQIPSTNEYIFIDDGDPFHIIDKFIDPGNNRIDLRIEAP